jgi:tRNA pseudouridine32 synthase/23S rRNA pseudouridine746 synthase
MDIEVPVPDIDDDGHRWLESGNIGEVLFGTHTQVDAALFRGLHKIRNDVLKGGFIRKKIIGTEYSIFLGKILRQAPKLLVGKVLRRCSGRAAKRHQLGGGSDDKNQTSCDEDEAQCLPRAVRVHGAILSRSYTVRMETRPSRLYLPKFVGSPKTIFEYLVARFPQVNAAVWHERVSQGLVTLNDGTKLTEQSPYRHGMTVFYRKQVPSEPPLLEEPVIVYRDDEIIVADKPHGIPVTPCGQHIERSLFIRLQRITELPDLAPVHRLDLDTAGLVLFTVRTDARAHYHRLFAEGRIEREYLAVAHVDGQPNRTHWRIENRIEEGEPWFLQRIVEGPVNAITEIELTEWRSGFGRFLLFPRTGKRHQLRLHMASIGFPIVGDPFYPAIVKRHDAALPLQLLARRLSFIDPLSGAAQNFASARNLSLTLDGKLGAV